MGRFKVKKQDTFIDMTPMSDVMVLLLTFFMLTATFVKEEPIKVNVPGSVSNVAVPEKNYLTIFIDNRGKVFLTMDDEAGQREMVQNMIDGGSLSLTPEQLKKVSQAPTLGTPLSVVGNWIDSADPNGMLVKAADAGIPCDSVNQELSVWVKAALDARGDDLTIAIKADTQTPYGVIKHVMDALRSVDANRYNLLTNLKSEE